MNRLVRITLAIVAGVLVGVGIAAAASGGTNRTGHSKVTHHVVARSLKRHFALFARAHVAAAKPLPPNVAASFNDASQAGLNYNPDAQAAVYVQPGSVGFWIVPGEGGACVVWETTALAPMAHANCLAASQVEKNGMTAISTTDGQTLIFGFRPNGATKVTVTNADGTTASSAVSGNAFAIVDPESTTQSISSQSGAGTAAITATRPLLNDQ